MPWRTLDLATGETTKAGLQCGHGFDAVENVRTRTRRSGRRSSFNAATALMPWRTSPGTVCGPAHWPLQCGHGFDAVENMDTWYVDYAVGELQCGHGFDAVENAAAWMTRSQPALPLQCGHGFDAVENGP